MEGRTGRLILWFQGTEEKDQKRICRVTRTPRRKTSASSGNAGSPFKRGKKRISGLDGYCALRYCKKRGESA